jgi:hypothetical protein
MPKHHIELIYKDLLPLVEHYVGSGETSASTLAVAGTNLFGRKFAGVFAADSIPKQHFKYAIVNLDNHDEPGSHWVGLARMGNGTYMVYDSFGRDTRKILPLIQLKTIQTEPDAEQLKSEENCGARSMAWIIIFDTYGEHAAQLI